MRRRGAVLLAACLTALAVGGRGTPQDPADGIPTRHLPHRSFDIPIDVARLEASFQKQGLAKPAAIQLMYTLNRGNWTAGPRHNLTALPQLDDGRRGFRFTAAQDGRYEFAVQYVSQDGALSPDRAALAPQQRVVIDTLPPTVRVNVAGKSISWEAQDGNLAPQVDVRCKWARDENGKTYPLAGGEWHLVTADGRGPFKPTDRFAWPELKDGEELFVQVVAHDYAGNDGHSPVVRVPGNGTFGASQSKPAPDWPPGLPSAGPGGSGAGPVPPAPSPRITYVSRPDVTVEYTLQKVGRSGVQAAHLYVQPANTTEWKFVEKFPVRLNPGDKEQSVPLRYQAPKEGLYGFYVVAESGAGLKDDPPGRDTPPMMYVVVDTEPPYARITGVQPRKGGANGPIVDLTWQVDDQYLLPKSISLEYSIDKEAAQWKKIEYGLDNDPGKNTGRFSWEVPDPNLWKFYVRIRALDKSGNRGEHKWGQTESSKDPVEVIVDLEKPAGAITGVRGGNTGGAPPAAGSRTLPESPLKKDPPQ